MNLISITPTLSKQNCLFFKIVSVLSLLIAVVIIIMSILMFAKKNKNWSILIVASLTHLVNFYMFLLFHSMCQSSLK